MVREGRRPDRGAALSLLQRLAPDGGAALNRSSGAVSSEVERLLYTQDVGGSIPSPPTNLGLLPNRQVFARAPVRS